MVYEAKRTFVQNTYGVFFTFVKQMGKDWNVLGVFAMRF